ncbi:MAG: SurA N-terminal domain-containing protein [Candidatus Delongbacteria bacterium]|nr:SurA N-terminal domain-containing protein [Candidatus Delongbacteria bacterium]
MAKAKTATKKVESKKKTTVKTTRKVNKVPKSMDQLTDRVNSLRKKKYFPVLIIVMVLISVAYIGRSLFFAALVGGKPITRIKLISELEKQAGQQALDSLITKELVNQEAKKKGVNISDVDISSEISRISDLLEQQGTTLEAALAMQGQSMDDLKENIRLQKTVEELLADSISVSDDEVTKYFEENKTYYGEDVEFDDIKDSIKDQLAQEKLTTEFQTLLERLKSEGNIIYFVNFE